MINSPPLSRTQWSLLLACWLIALVSSLGSLFFSEVMKLEPCVLCWYQRIAMFPLALILAQGLYTQDRQSVKYALPLAWAGGLVALYHCLLYAGFIPQGLRPCGKGSSCAEQKLELAGFITIPLLSVLAFSLIILLLISVKKGLPK
ncbi:disulfide bond formation protein DsbB [Polaromonas sp. OV174]|uniref:disulfide bond formation protein B n=1 Tax=Polaromonas sp. OV174 TaxID=1855300 RepID=UPI0008E75157|nr:disulfide bond formation protein B [Polaromonas sp. OV174]SFB75449.1 disulfide bond formation protein DsbB [Polaromonas sp. OV174]